MDDNENELEIVWTDEMFDELFEFAHELYPEEMELAINTADSTGDFEFLTTVLNAANKVLTSQSLSHLVELGILEIDGVDETGDYTLKLAEGVEL